MGTLPVAPLVDRSMHKLWWGRHGLRRLREVVPYGYDNKVVDGKDGGGGQQHGEDDQNDFRAAFHPAFFRLRAVKSCSG